MSVKTAFELRLHRARQLIAEHAVHPTDDLEEFKVDSQGGGRKYAVHLSVDHDEAPGCVLEAQCTCADWRKMDEWLNEYPMNPGLSHINYNAACKHVLAACIAVGAVE